MNGAAVKKGNAEIPYLLHEANFQHYPALGSDASSVSNFCGCSSDAISHW